MFAYRMIPEIIDVAVMCAGAAIDYSKAKGNISRMRRIGWRTNK